MSTDNESFPISKWSQGDQPREKLLYKGKEALSDAELLAILIRIGSPNESAVSLSKRILSKVDNNLNALGKLTIQELISFKGIGEAKAISIAAALELGRRRREGETLKRNKISSSRSVFDLLQPIMGDLLHEEFWIVYLNNSNKVIQTSQLSKGGITGTLVDVRLVMKTAIQLNATSIILAHNHPSGTLKPSTADKEITKKLKDGGTNLDIKVLDHLIIADNTYYSFADEGIL